RSGYAIYFAPRFGSTDADSFGSSGASVSASWVSSVSSFIPLNPLSNPFPSGVVFQPPTSTAGQVLMGQSINIMDRRNVGNQYSQQWNLDLQGQLPGNWLVEASYAGNKGTHLPVGWSFNQLDPKYQSLGNALNTAVRNPFFGLVSSGVLANPTVSQS